MEVSQHYFKLEKDAQQSDPVSAYLFCLEILFTIVKSNKDIKSLTILGNSSLYTAYADETNFFLENLGWIKELLNTTSLFSLFSCLKSNLSKCEVARTGLLKGAKVAVFGIKYADLTKDVVKTLGTFLCIIKILNQNRISEKL